MRLEFTPALERAIERASAFALRASRGAIEPHDLLAALLADDDERSVQMLVQARANVAAWRAQAGVSDAAAAGSLPLPLHAATLRVLSRAGELALLHSEDGSVRSDQVLFALLEDAEMRGQLEAHGLDFAQVQALYAHEFQPPVQVDPLLLEVPPEAPDLARVLDASANRAREALRVLEDFARFVRNDAFLSGELKRARHALAQALALLPAAWLLASRDTEHDVGTSISTPAEWDRPSLFAVVQANLKRLQEALRSLEEFGKVFGAEFAAQIEALRYQSYTLEQRFAPPTNLRVRLAQARLYVLVTESRCRLSLPGTVREAVEGGAAVVQLREKQRSDREVLALAREVRRITRDAGSLFIMNDRPDLAVLSEADAVHLGQDDLEVRAARRIVGPDALLGVSTHDVAQVQAALADGADYLGIGPTFPSKTKSFDALAGLEFIRQASALSSLPMFALGGITLDNLAQVRQAGATRVAVSDVVCSADDPRTVCRLLSQALATD